MISIMGACAALIGGMLMSKRALAVTSLNPKNGMQNSVRTRIIDLEGTHNFRDLGGYKATEGRQVVWGKLFRSDDLAMLTDQDIAALAALPLRTTVDFRTKREVQSAPDRNPPTVIHSVWLPIDPGCMQGIERIEQGEGKEYMCDLNRALARDFCESYKTFFSYVGKQENTPLVFHCTAGKDRTGLAAALFLAALGVDRQTIMDDYLLSSTLIVEKYAVLLAKKPMLRDVVVVQPEYLATAFEIIDTEFDGMESYLKYQLGVNQEQLQEIYTEAVE